MAQLQHRHQLNVAKSATRISNYNHHQVMQRKATTTIGNMKANAGFIEIMPGPRDQMYYN